MTTTQTEQAPIVERDMIQKQDLDRREEEICRREEDLCRRE